MNRLKSESGHIEQVSTELVPIAIDNLVCAVCKEKLYGDSWAMVSHPKQKGIIVFAHKACVNEAQALLSKLL